MIFSDEQTPDVSNLYARLGNKSPHFCFAGHTDVVPLGNPDLWSVNPFGGEIIEDVLFGRGATDMKSAIAAFVAAVSRVVNTQEIKGSVSLLITGDEEGPAINGTRKVLEWMRQKGEKIDACLVGEPTNPQKLGEMVKIGRRGSLTGTLTVTGVQGHTAYPHLADNPIPRLIRMLDAITSKDLDKGTEHFQPSNIQITSIDTNNPASNVIPSKATAKFNIRFNDKHTGDSLKNWLLDKCNLIGGDFSLEVKVSGEAFHTPRNDFITLIVESIHSVTGVEPVLSTSGGTSDARFIKDFCPVAEFGLVGQTMHKIDERIAVADIISLTDIYAAILAKYFR